MTTDQKKILIVEDEDVIALPLADTLKQENFSVFTAVNGLEGLDIAMREKPDLIILDILMPKMDGLEMLRRLRQDAWGKTVRVIVLTNVGDTSKMADVVDEQVTDYLLKVDWDLNEVLNLIKQRLGV
ncbi:MAG TPA: response regulator [Candidatus Paceibacterota bacterium]